MMASGGNGLEFARKVEYNMGMNTYTISLDWDGEASKWYALNDDIPIMLEDASLDAPRKAGHARAER